MIWEVKLIVDQKKLGDVLEAIDGLVLDKSVQGVKGAELTRKGKIVETNPKGGGMADKVATLIDRKEPFLSKENFIKYIKKVGGNPDGISYYVRMLREAKVLGDYDREQGYVVLRTVRK